MFKGTEALQTYLNQHPQMVQSTKYEVHFFDYRWLKTKQKIADSQIEMLRREYAETYFYPSLLKKRKHNQDLELFTFEKTPSYIFHPLIPERIKVICPWAKIIILLRDPVGRAYSAYKMNRKRYYKRYGETTFESVIQTEIDILNEIGILDEGFLYLDKDERQMKWLKYWRWFEHHRKISNAFIGRGLYFLQLEIWYKHYQDEARKNILIIKSENLLPSKTTNKINLKLITDFIGIPEYEVTHNQTIHATKDIGPMKNETRQYLERLFEPFNKRLHSLLGDGWEDPWPY